MDLTDWDNPSPEHRPLPIKHSLTHDADWKGWVARAAQRGYGGVVTNVSWQAPYLESPEAWERLREVVSACADHRLRVWLYDELGFPSGAAGGHVLRADPTFEAQCLADTGRVSSRFTVMPAFENTPAANMGHLVRRCANIMDDKAMGSFLEATYEAYRRELGPSFRHVECFFTDEPSLVAYHTQVDPARFEQLEIVIDKPDLNLKPLARIPWVVDLPARFKQRYRKELGPLIPLLFEGNSAAARSVRRQYWGLVADLVKGRYFGRLGRWCARNGVAFSGHLLCEEGLWLRIILDGNALACLREMQVPGMDLLSSRPEGVFDAQYWLTALQPASAALHNGTRRVMSEVSDFEQSLGWIKRPAATLPEIKATAAWQAALGVTEFTLYYDTDGWSEADCRSYCDYVGRLNALLREANPSPTVALYYPLAELREDFTPSTKAANEVIYPERFSALNRAFDQAGRWLLEHQYGFALIDEEALRWARCEDGHLVVGGGRFDVLVLPEGAALPELRRIGPWLKEAGRVVHDVAAVAGRTRPVVEVSGDSSRLLCTAFRREGGSIIAMVNVGSQPYEGDCILPAAGGWRVLDPATGVITDVVATDGMLRLRLESFEARLLVRG